MLRFSVIWSRDLILKFIVASTQWKRGVCLIGQTRLSNLSFQLMRNIASGSEDGVHWGLINCSSLFALLHCLPFSPPTVCRIFSFEPKSITSVIEANKASFRFCVLFIWSITMRMAQLAKIRYSPPRILYYALLYKFSIRKIIIVSLRLFPEPVLGFKDQFVLYFFFFSAIKKFDVILLVPNFLFLVFLVYKIGKAQVQLHKIKCPIVKTVSFMVRLHWVEQNKLSVNVIFSFPVLQFFVAQPVIIYHCTNM